MVVNGDQVLVMKRHKRGRDYAVLPGGGIEDGETPAEAALRELHEETTLVAEIDRLLWTGWHNDRPAWYFLMTAVRGNAELSGPEAIATRPDNSFELRWITTDRFAELGLHPPDIRGPLAELLTGRPTSSDAGPTAQRGGVVRLAPAATAWPPVRRRIDPLHRLGASVNRCRRRITGGSRPARLRRTQP